MSVIDLRFETAHSILSHLSSGMVPISNLVASRQDYDLLISSRPWIAADRLIVRRTIDSILFGSLDLLGLPRYELPAEYVAAVLSLFVSPVNLFIACSWCEHGGTDAESLSQLGCDDLEPFTSSQLFALVSLLLSHNRHPVIKASFEKKTKMRLSDVEDQPVK